MGDDPDGYRTMPETVDFIERYASLVPVSVRYTTRHFRAWHGRWIPGRHAQGTWRCRAVVIASGAFNIAHIPSSRRSSRPELRS